MNEELYITGSDDILSVGTGYTECEWCFQFDDEEPHPFASSESDDPYLTITIRNTSESILVFTHGDKTFKIFARQKTKK